MKKYFINAFVFIIVLTATNIFAFDGERKGFVIGVGIGGGHLSIKISGDRFEKGSEAVLTNNFKIGFGLSNSLDLSFHAKGSWWREGCCGDRATILNGLFAAGVTKYLSSSGRGLFFSGGAGFAMLDDPFEPDINFFRGFGLFGGVGYELFKHTSLQADIVYTHVYETNGGDDIDTIGLRISLNFLAY